MRIESEEEYEAALREVAEILALDVPIDSVTPATDEELERLDELATAIEAWEAEHYPIDPPTTEASLEFHRDRVAGSSLNPLIAVVGEHPECSWSLRKATEEEKAEHGGVNRLDFVVEIGGVFLYASRADACEFLEWVR